MCKTVKRGYFVNDKRDFSHDSILKLYKAGYDLLFLLNQGYHIKGAVTFVGNHYLLSERQRLALMRGISSNEKIEYRKSKQIKNNFGNRIVNIDGFNTIITLEVALSNSLLLKCMDSTIRDLAALRGSYRMIDKTHTAIQYIGQMLENYHIKKAIFYLDAPVSNSGRLKTHILETLQQFHYEIEVNVINDVDRVLEKLDNVITSDAIILDKCNSWINLNSDIIEKNIKNCNYIDFENNTLFNDLIK